MAICAAALLGAQPRLLYRPEDSNSMSQRRALCTITTRATAASASAATARASRVPMPKKPGTAVLSRKKKLPGVAYQYKYRYRQLPESLKNQALNMEKNAPLTVPVMPRQPTLTVIGSDRRYPVRRVYCVGSNYRDHAVEMGNDPDKNPPFFFSKPSDAIVDASRPEVKVPYPQETEDLHYEVELVVALGKGGRSIPVESALRCVFGVGVGVDLTRRDMQRAAKKLGRPWDCSKGFDSSGPVGALIPIRTAAFTEQDHKENIMEARRKWRVGGEIGEFPEPPEFVPLAERRISLSVDGALRQEALLGDMLWGIPEMVSRLSQFFTLEPGDLLFTGTPAGVGPLQTGNVVEALVQGLEPCRFEVIEPLPATPFDTQ